jgi:hypothetical protein
MKIIDYINNLNVLLNNHKEKNQLIEEIIKVYPNITKWNLYDFLNKIEFNSIDKCWGYQFKKVIGKHKIELIPNIRLMHYRYMYLIANNLDTLNSEDLIRHQCHNKFCLNPNHLKSGTHQDNKNDNILKGQVNPTWSHLMTYEKIEDLIIKLKNKYFKKLLDIEEYYGIDNTTFYNITKLHVYSDIITEICLKHEITAKELRELSNFNSGECHPNSKYKDSDFREILEKVFSGEIKAVWQASELYKIPSIRIYEFLNRKNRVYIIDSFCEEHNITCDDLKNKLYF